MTEAEKAGREYVKTCGNDEATGSRYFAFLAGAAWQREQDAKLCDRQADVCANHDDKVGAYTCRTLGGYIRAGSSDVCVCPLECSLHPEECQCEPCINFRAEEARTQDEGAK
jgi:hypothetical protein